MDKITFDTFSPFYNILLLVHNKIADLIKNEIVNFSKLEVKFHTLNSEIDEETLYRLTDLIIADKSTKEEYLIKGIHENIPIIFIGDDENLKPYISVAFNTNELKELAGFVRLIQINRRLRRAIIESQRENLKINEDGIKIQIEGSFDSSYSLAIVNREIARALNKLFPGKVALYSTDGYGDFEPNVEFLKRDKEVYEMWERSSKGYHAEIVMRNPYPPRIYDMKGVINSMTSYGWEESEYPKEYLEDFNIYLDLLPVTSPYVEKVMIDNGIAIPVFTVGLGADHVLRLKPEPYPLKTKKRFKFLHVSSCFPRKGVDILLDAYTSVFSGDDDVVLIIKTFPNPHNNVEELIKKYTKDKENPPKIELINKDIPYEQLVYLYQVCNCVVLPSRGEGFGLPAAEAMLFKKPVIVTNYGGFKYFCNDNNAWLIDYKFAKAKTHMNLPLSYWVEPSKEELMEKLKEIYTAPEEEIAQKTERAYKDIIENFTWDKTVKRLMSAIEKTKKLPVFLKNDIKVGVISSWNTRCGIAQYSEFLVENLSRDIEVRIVAPKVPEKEIINSSKESKNVRRVWKRVDNDRDISNIIEELKDVDAVVIQHHFAYFDTNYLGKLIKALKEKRKKVFITFHSLSAPPHQDLRNIKENLAKLERIFVHSINDLNKLKDKGLIENVALFPHGVNQVKVDHETIRNLKRTYGLEGKFIIGTFGYLRKHKGVKELIEAFTLLRKEFPEVHLLLLTSLYPSQDSVEYFEECKAYIVNKGLVNDVTFITEYIPEEDIYSYISLMDVVVYPYQFTGESSSAAVRYAIATKKTIICTPLSIFDDVSDVVIFTASTDPYGIYMKLKEFISFPEKFKEYEERMERYLKAVNWESLGKRLSNIIKYFTVLKPNL
ncbi:glycosyltransferase [Aquifex aeolicus]|uniref:Glycosyl transferase family 1 domain-containing protein n=1 Tax=Aquifex aeolicus (strain VF5) TaxID=224324 RepID=O67173_AQUAE|nr:glycosyltransferase [Aquifex aeolicus]AAC07138.1 putative protein [Aquifex aeolicus VF5]